MCAVNSDYERGLNMGKQTDLRLYPGMFITFEGIDGSGKSTQIRMLEEYFQSKGRRTVVTREPGGTPLGEKIRNILLDRDNEISDVAEMLLYAASRAQLVQDVIIPSLKEGKVILCDRYLDSSIAYQAYGRELGSQVLRVNASAVHNCMPDLTFLFDLPVRTGKSRAAEEGEPDRLELEKDIFFSRVRNGYLKIAEQNPSRVKLIDGTLSINAVSERVLRFTSDKWTEIFGRDL